MKQLPLPFAETQSYAAVDFCAAPSNALAQSWVERPEGWTNGRLVLWGESGCGKTHLLHIWAESHGAVLLHGPDLRGALPPASGPVAIDDADAVADETTLLHSLNAAAEAGQPALLTARTPPARQKITLPDLASRLRASLAVQIFTPDDELLDMLLTRLAAERQLALNFQVRNFLLSHLPRAPAALREAVARLDHAALATGGKITRNMAAALVAEFDS
jgi:chromosomal replication initiation ATPase DnaA